MARPNDSAQDESPEASVDYRIGFGAADLVNVRFAPSPLWELIQAVRVLIDPRQQRFHLPWLDRVRLRLANLDLDPLLAVLPLRGYSVDLLAPPPGHPRVTAAEQIQQVRATPESRVAEEVARAFGDRGGQPVPPAVRRLAEHPARLRDRLADCLEAAWEVLLAPHWTRVGDLLAADIAHHSRVLADSGLGRLFSVLHPGVRWDGNRLRVEVDSRPEHQGRSRAGGLLLMPSAFVWPYLVLIWDYQPQPTLVYPARGVGELWQPVVTPGSAVLGRLLGRTRATLLSSLVEPGSTTLLARRHGLSPATVSQHLAALTGAGLLTTHRQGRSVVYALTPLGDALLAGAVT